MFSRGSRTNNLDIILKLDGLLPTVVFRAVVILHHGSRLPFIPRAIVVVCAGVPGCLCASEAPVGPAWSEYTPWTRAETMRARPET